MTQALLAMTLFCALISGLVGLILLARRLLLPQGVSRICVNERRRVEAALGERLLDALGAAGIALPSACGGKGTCGQCRVRVLGVAPPARATERARLAPRDLAAGARLACQLTQRSDLEIEIPEEIFGVRQWVCRVRSARCVGTLIREIVAELPASEKLDFRAGSFVQVTAPPYALRYRELPIDASVRDEWDRLDLWRYTSRCDAPTTRAYSLANPPSETDRVVLLVRLALPPPGAAPEAPPGVVSSYLFSVTAGDALEVAGPYGEFAASESACEMVVVGGGAGMAPLRSILLDQLATRGAKRRVSFWYGARNRRELFYAEEFDRLAAEHANFAWVPALSEPEPGDAWPGETGFIHEVLERHHLAQHPRPEACEYYLCGPPLMIRATTSLLQRFGVPPERVYFDDFGG